MGSNLDKLGSRFVTKLAPLCLMRLRQLLLQLKILCQKARIFLHNHLVKRLYLLDESRRLAILNSLDEVGKQGGDLGNGFESGHNLNPSKSGNGTKSLRHITAIGTKRQT
jgi:hypothetical protein